MAGSHLAAPDLAFHDRGAIARDLLHVLLRSSAPAWAPVRRLMNAGVTLALGTDGGSSNDTALAPRGHLVSFGQASGPVGNWDIGRFSSKSITVSRPNYSHYTDTPEKLGPHVNRFFGALRQGILRIEAPTRYELARAADAHRDLEQRRTTGSLVLVV